MCSFPKQGRRQDLIYRDAITIAGTPKEEGTLEIRSCVSKVLLPISCSHHTYLKSENIVSIHNASRKLETPEAELLIL